MILEQVAFNTVFKIQVVHSIPGRFRVKIPLAKRIPLEWRFEDSYFDCFKMIQGIEKVEFNYTTANAVVKYDGTLTNEKKILQDIKDMVKIVSKHKKVLAKFDSSRKDEAYYYIIGILKEHFV